MGFRVTLVQNFTDIADTIIDRARERGMEPLELARHYSEAYLEAMDRLGVERADVYPKVSEHIDAIIEMIQGLIEKGAAYESQGSVFFRVDAFPEYGKLSNQRKEELMAGRVSRWTRPRKTISISLCGSGQNPESLPGQARGGPAARAGTSSAPQCRSSTLATPLTFTAAAST